jgi:hypothetical protein
MTDNVSNFLKYKLKRDIIDPRYKEINHLSSVFRKNNFKQELELLSQYYEKFNIFVDELEKANWVVDNTPPKIYEELNVLSKQLYNAAEARLKEHGI